MLRINLTPTRKHRLKSDYGLNDYYKYYVEEMGGILPKHEYNKVFRLLIAHMRQIVVENNYRYKLPARMGIITTKKYKNKIKIVDGKTIINYPPDFNATLKLWEEYPELAEKKQLVRYENKHTNGHTYRIVYKKFSANYKNKTLYMMHFNRAFTTEMKDFINEHGEIDRDML